MIFFPFLVLLMVLCIRLLWAEWMVVFWYVMFDVKKLIWSEINKLSVSFLYGIKILGSYNGFCIWWMDGDERAFILYQRVTDADLRALVSDEVFQAEPVWKLGDIQVNWYNLI